MQYNLILRRAFRETIASGLRTGTENGPSVLSLALYFYHTMDGSAISRDLLFGHALLQYSVCDQPGISRFKHNRKTPCKRVSVVCEML